MLHGEAGDGSVRVAVVGDVTRAAEGVATSVAVLFGPDGKPVTGTERSSRFQPQVPRVSSPCFRPSPARTSYGLLSVTATAALGASERHVDATWHQAGGVATTGLVLFRSPSGPGGSLEPLFDVVSTGDKLIAQVPLSAPLATANGQVTFEVARVGTAVPSCA